jgi:hypothetical protein
MSLNRLSLNALALNRLSMNALMPNGLSSSRPMTVNGHSSNAAICVNVTSFNASSFEGCSENTTVLQNGTLCFNLSQPLNVAGTNCADGDCHPLTSQELAVLVLLSLESNNTNDSDGNETTVPSYRFSELVEEALTGSNLPYNMSLILSGAAGDVAQDYLLAFLNYTVSCALNSNQSVTIQLGEQTVVLEGSLGLAQSWARRGIDAADQEAVSACLAARLNFFGVQVQISIRGRGLEPPSADEIAEYPLQEGAFWGNIFAEEPELFACTNRANVQNSYANLRFCSTGFPVPDGSTISCGPLRNVGSCSARCEVSSRHPDEFRACFGNQEVLSIFLPRADQ